MARGAGKAETLKMQFRKALPAARAILAGTLLLGLSAWPAMGATAAVTSELVVADRQSGVALFGFDPVAYFLKGEAEIGSERIELSFAGFAWRFRSEANRAAFRSQPDAYVPRFGGYDPIALGRGAPVSGNPQIFAVHDGRIYLFQRPEHRVSFLAAPQTAIEAARANWPQARKSLVH
jgi:YHS domain-containing protein